MKSQPSIDEFWNFKEICIISSVCFAIIHLKVAIPHTTLRAHKSSNEIHLKISGLKYTSIHLGRTHPPHSVSDQGEFF